ncbi:SAM-dependent methyltransferase [Dyadobacter sp. BE34]|uniref:SAM-dependent methyltransferase n=1 Tax=Dyadobacter fermentans TaxID=94254 RepID=A0ABU1QY05_9BACT|nr:MULTISPECIES: methyltransferase domain-containing protein [Dyadobacter]MDR6805973.1 SAM-dependent methyltransferase [Dyadobacter fermentans]MDR7043713.1 SAM-dependent methyltransferase [Dyadobacter sp. BE242]MDR7198025.1 SAM-dependent methyltransferase [Dyadobacter sp. BE34]MDR7215987.1 SAM-dependent methyltransferase [Dyadobacter sp. BE31]MDR7264487.1 SAM-dependent methyltransferase [Dyadobacter sp. BE32]
MANKLSQRLADIVDTLPLKEGVRVLEIGCGPGAAARQIASRISKGYVLGIDRSAKAINLAIGGSQDEMATGRLSFRQSAIEYFELSPGEEKYDLAFAVRVGALDGRHPETERRATLQIKKVLKEDGRLFVYLGDTLKEVPL